MEQHHCIESLKLWRERAAERSRDYERFQRLPSYVSLRVTKQEFPEIYHEKGPISVYPFSSIVAV